MAHTFRARDGWFVLAAGSERMWTLLCDTIGRPGLKGDPRFATNADRLTHRRELIPLLKDTIAAHKAEHWLSLFRKLGIPCGPINFVDETLSDPHIRDRGVIVELEHPAAGLVRSIATPVRLSETPVSYRLPPPILGQHNAEVLAELGYGPADVARLETEGVI